MKTGEPNGRHTGRAAGLLLCLVAILSVVLGSCSSDRVPTATPTESAPDFVGKTVRLGTNPEGSLFFALGTGIAAVASTRSPVAVTVKPYPGSTAFMSPLENGELELGINGGVDMYLAYRGLDARYPPITKVRAVQRGAPVLVGALVRNDSPIKTLADVKGARVGAEYTPQIAIWYATTGMLANAGLAWADVLPVPVANTTESVQALIVGRLDMAVGAVGADEVKRADELVPGGIRFLSLDTSAEAMKRLQAVAPYQARVLAAGAEPAVRGETAVLEYDLYLTAGSGVDEETIYHIARALWEQTEQLAPFNPRLAEWTRERVVSPRSVLPYHPGAIRLYREAGVWTAEMDQVQARLLGEAGTAVPR